ncbi:MAG: hypothetical protein WCX84_04100 [Syntrophales bacterium]|nr:hypothetical protein [Syntrophales bacterium]
MKKLIIFFAVFVMFCAVPVQAADPAGTAPPMVKKPGLVKPTREESDFLLKRPHLRCCISGHYEGKMRETHCKEMGSKPTSGKVTLDIDQGASCGSAFEARSVNAGDGKVTHFKGTVTPGSSKECCNFTAQSISGRDNVHLKGEICCEKTKNCLLKGQFTSVDCSGVTEMRKMH